MFTSGSTNWPRKSPSVRLLYTPTASCMMATALFTSAAVFAETLNTLRRERSKDRWGESSVAPRTSSVSFLLFGNQAHWQPVTYLTPPPNILETDDVIITPVRRCISLMLRPPTPHTKPAPSSEMRTTACALPWASGIGESMTWLTNSLVSLLPSGMGGACITRTGERAPECVGSTMDERSAFMQSSEPRCLGCIDYSMGPRVGKSSEDNLQSRAFMEHIRGMHHARATWCLRELDGGWCGAWSDV